MMAYEGGTTKQAFQRFVNDALLPALRKGDVVVIDNLRAHHSYGVKEAIERAGCTLLYLPPYSPELNPIELLWSKLKGLLRKAEARTLRLLAAALKHSQREITGSDIEGWFDHCGYADQLN